MQNLIKIYIATGAIFGGSYYMYNFIYGGSKITKQSYYTEAIELLKGYKPAVANLGKKFEVEDFDESDSFNEINDKNVKIKLIVKGDKKLADFFVYASRQELEREWNIDKLEIKYRGSVNKYKIFDRSLIKTNTTQTTNSTQSK